MLVKTKAIVLSSLKFQEKSEFKNCITMITMNRLFANSINKVKYIKENYIKENYIKENKIKENNIKEN